MSLQKNLWYNRGEKRRNQIHKWLFNILRYEYNSYQSILLSLRSGETDTAYFKFKEFIDTLEGGNIKFEDGDILGYLIEENKTYFGEEAINSHLFRNFVTRIKFTPTPPTETIKFKPSTQKKLKEAEKKRQLQQKRYYTKVKKEKVVAKFEYVKKDNNLIPVLRDKKGRFAKQNKSFKKELKRRGFK